MVTTFSRKHSPRHCSMSCYFIKKMKTLKVTGEKISKWGSRERYKTMPKNVLLCWKIHKETCMKPLRTSWHRNYALNRRKKKMGDGKIYSHVLSLHIKSKSPQNYSEREGEKERETETPCLPLGMTSNNILLKQHFWRATCSLSETVQHISGILGPCSLMSCGPCYCDIWKTPSHIFLSEVPPLFVTHL